MVIGIVILGSEQPGGGQDRRSGGNGGDAKYSKSYSTWKISENPQKPENPQNT